MNVSAATDVFTKFADQQFSFTDCSSFVLAKETQVDEVFTFDDDFRLMGLSWPLFLKG